ncbi:MAG: LOG family protein [bacterium]|nr:LOG family protein [bacterium]
MPSHEMGHDLSIELEQPENEKQWKNFSVAVFGSRDNGNKYAVENSDVIGRILARDGYNACNGGYKQGGMGAMARAFVSECREQGMTDEEIKPHLIGFVMPKGAIEAMFDEPTERPLIGADTDTSDKSDVTAATIEERPTLEQRQGDLIQNADAWIATEGGSGTVAEIMEALLSERDRRDSSDPSLARPVIIIDNEHKALRYLLEKAKHEEVRNIPADTFYILSGRKMAEGNHDETIHDLPVVPRSLPEDDQMTKQLEMILEYHSLLKENNSENDDRIAEIRKQLFDPESGIRALTLDDIFRGDKTEATT